MLRTILIIPAGSIDESEQTLKQQLKQGVLFKIPEKEKLSTIDVDLPPEPSKYVVKAVFLDEVLKILKKDTKEITDSDIDFMKDGFFNV